MNTEKLWKCTQPELRDFLKGKGRDPLGTKQELIARVVDLGLEKDLIEFSTNREGEYEKEKSDDDQPAAADEAPRKRAERGKEEQEEPAEKRAKVKDEPINNEPAVFTPIPGKEYSTAELANLSKTDLAHFCIAKDLPTHGNRETLFMRIIALQTERNQARGGASSSSAAAKSELIPVKASPSAGDEGGGSGAGECAVCIDAKANHAMVPCGHCCLCRDCARENEFTECPICRCQVSTVMSIYHNFADDEPAPTAKPKRKAKAKKKDAKKSAADMKAKLDAEKIRPLPKAWEGVVQPREEFLLKVPWDETSIEEPLALRCLLCNKWADTCPESHGRTDGSKDHTKNLRSLPLDPTWWNNHISQQKEAYFKRYPVLKRVPFPDLTVEEPEAKEQNDEDGNSDEDDDEVACIGGSHPAVGLGAVGNKKTLQKGHMSDLDFLEMIATNMVCPVTIELYPLERDRV